MILRASDNRVLHNTKQVEALVQYLDITDIIDHLQSNNTETDYHCVLLLRKAEHFIAGGQGLEQKSKFITFQFLKVFSHLSSI